METSKQYKKRKFDLLLESGEQCRVWIAFENVKVGQKVFGTTIKNNSIEAISGIVKSVIAIDGVKTKQHQNKENVDV
jgi:hypothetical protein